MTAAFDEAVISVLGSLPASMPSFQAQADFHPEAAAATEGCLSIPPIQTICYDSEKMILEPFPNSSASTHGIKLSTEDGRWLPPFRVGTGVHYVVGLSELNPADFPRGLADIQSRNNRATFNLLPVESGQWTIQVVSSDSLFESIDLGNLVQKGIETLAGSLTLDTGVPILKTPKLYLVRAFNGGFAALSDDKDELSFINTTLTERESRNARLDNAALAVNAIIGGLDVLGIWIDLKGILGNRELDLVFDAGLELRMPHKCVYSNQIDRLITEQFGSEKDIMEAPEPA